MTDHSPGYGADGSPPDDRPDQDVEVEALAAGAVDTRGLAALAVLRAVYERGDPVPPTLVDRVDFAITLDDLEAEVAQLQRGTVPELVARSDGEGVETQRAQTVTFTSDSVTTMVTITPVDDSSVRLDGWAAPGAGLAVELRVAATSHHVVADEDGRFVFERVGHGLAQLVLRPATPSGGHTVVTPPSRSEAARRPPRRTPSSERTSCTGSRARQTTPGTLRGGAGTRGRV